MTLDELQMLLKVARLTYLKEQNRMRNILAEEAKLRRQLAKLDDLSRKAQAELTHSQAMKQIGADVTWRSWQDRTRRELNISLARVMARKLPFQEKLRQSFGRITVLEKMIEAEARNRRKLTARQQMDRLLNS